VQGETEVGKAVEQMQAAVTTINSAVSLAPLPSSTIDQLRHIYQQIEKFITTD